MEDLEGRLRAAITQAAEGRDIIERFDRENKVIEISRDVTNPSLLRSIEEALRTFGYRLEQLS